MNAPAAPAKPAAPELKPYIAAPQRVPEFTIQAVLLGFILAIVFNAANAYLGLKIGLTVSAGIPSAIISMAVLRLLLPRFSGRHASILENNIVHTIASTGEALAAAIIFTVPALYFLGSDISNESVFLLGAAGGLLGLFIMIPLRHSLVVREHRALPFPEGTACAKVLVAGDKGGTSAAPVFWGIGFGAAYKFAMSALGLFKDSLSWSFPRLHQAGFGYEVSPLLLGVGYLVGLRIAAMMLAGGLLGYWVLIPLIHAMGGSNVVAPGTVPIDQMSTGELRSTYVRYIGAGGVAFGGLVSLLRSLPDIASSLRHSLSTMAQARAARSGGEAARDWEERPIVIGAALLGAAVGAAFSRHPWSTAGGAALHLLQAAAGAALFAGAAFFAARAAARSARAFSRTEHDLPLPLAGAGVAGVLLLLWLHPAFGLSLAEAVIVVLFCFFFVAVSARMVGLIGSTNQPVSGMTITALLSMTLLFAFLGHDPATLRTTAIMAGAAVCIAISLSGDLSQDLKTAALIGGTPWKVQLAEVMGTMIAAVRTGFILWLLYTAYGFGAPTADKPNPLEAPQAQLMSQLVKGATGGELPWTLLLTGAGIGLVAELCGLSALALAIGLYLPIELWPPMLIGGLLAWHVARRKGEAAGEQEPGSLYASGLVAGEALMGIGIAFIVVLSGTVVAPGLAEHLKIRDPEAGSAFWEGALSTGVYALAAWAFWRAAMRRTKSA